MRNPRRRLPLIVIFVVILAFIQFAAYTTISLVAWAQNTPSDFTPEFVTEERLDETGKLPGAEATPEVRPMEPGQEGYFGTPVVEREKVYNPNRTGVRYSPEARKSGFRLTKSAPTVLGTTLKIFIFLIFFLMMLTPFIPGIIELYRPRDDHPLYVDQDYVRDPRFFGKSFRRLLMQPEIFRAPVSMQTIQAKLSRMEQLEIADDKQLASNSHLAHLLLVRGDLDLGDHAVLEKEVYVQGDTFIKHNVQFRAMACDGDLILGPSSRVVRWLDVNGNITAEKGANLGVSSACGQTLSLDADVEFRRLFALPVRTYGRGRPDAPRIVPPPPEEPEEQEKEKLENVEDDLDYVKGSLTLAENDQINRDLVVKGDLHAKEGAVFHGTVKVYGKTNFDKEVVVKGNLFCEGDIQLDEDCEVWGNVFCQSSVFLGKGCRIGQKGKVKSIIGKKAVTFSENVIVHGYVLTEGKGRVI